MMKQKKMNPCGSIRKVTVMADQKYCASCGMPMKEAADFGGGRESNFYCVH